MFDLTLHFFFLFFCGAPVRGPILIDVLTHSGFLGAAGRRPRPPAGHRLLIEFVSLRPSELLFLVCDRGRPQAAWPRTALPRRNVE
jgi:hypothetical protein